MLYRSNVLMYDRETESLWSQIKGEAVTGPLTGTELKVLPSTLTTWGKWSKQYPQTEVLSLSTGYKRNYDSDPYLDYYGQQSGFMSFFKLGPGEKEKELVIGIEVEGKTKAYPLDLVRSRQTIVDQFSGITITLSFDSINDHLTVKDGKGKILEHMLVYWFVWKGIWPDTIRY